MPDKWEISDIEGCVRLLDAFNARRLGPEPFSQACVTLWAADRDLKPGRPGQQREKSADALMREVTAGRLGDAEFGRAWAALWACGYKRPRARQLIIDLLHHWAYHFSSDQNLRAENPQMYIDEWRLWDVMLALRAVIRILTEEDWFHT